jgi:hypothetical protein
MMTRKTQTMRRTSQRAFRPGFDDLEGRQLLTVVGGFPGESTPSAPAIATFRNQLYIAWRGTDNRLNIENLATGSKTTLPDVDTTSAAPALTPFGGRLVLAYTGTDAGHHLNVLSTTDGVHWGDKGILGQTTFASDGPALTAYGRFLVIAWTGTDTRLNDAYSVDSMNFGPANTFGAYYGATSQYGPALITLNGDLYVAWTGTDTRLNYLDLRTSQKTILRAGGQFPHSNNAPSLASDGNQLYLAWTGMDQTGRQDQVNVVDATTGVQVQPTFESSYDGPSLTFGPGNTRYIAWSGTDAFTLVNYEVV